MSGLTQVIYAQKVYEGQVVDKSTENPIPAVTVKLINKNIGNQTNDQGYFRLVTDSASVGDTLVFSFVGYKTYRLPVSNYKSKMFVMLEPLNTLLTEVTVNGNKVKTLTIDKFSYSDIKDVSTDERSIHTTYPYYTLGSFAKFFETPISNSKLMRIELGRRDFDIPVLQTNFPQTTSGKFTRFLIHVMTVDTITGKPEKKIFTKEITLTDNALKVTIDLKDDKIMLPSNNFFIVVEWLKIIRNEVVKLEAIQKLERVRKNGNQLTQDDSRYTIMYQPFLIAFSGPQATHGWVAIDNVNWVPLKLNLNIALAATIIY